MKGSQRTKDKGAVDLTWEHGGKAIAGLEIKSMMDNKNSKIAVHKSSKIRKLAWMILNQGAVVHTLVVDDRNTFAEGTPESKKQWSGGRLYYKRGAGAFRLQNEQGTVIMHRAKNFAAVLRLIEADEGSLPQAARASTIWNKAIESLQPEIKEVGRVELAKRMRNQAAFMDLAEAAVAKGDRRLGNDFLKRAKLARQGKY